MPLLCWSSLFGSKVCLYFTGTVCLVQKFFFNCKQGSVRVSGSVRARAVLCLEVGKVGYLCFELECFKNCYITILSMDTFASFLFINKIILSKKSFSTRKKGIQKDLAILLVKDLYKYLNYIKNELKIHVNEFIFLKIFLQKSSK